MGILLVEDRSRAGPGTLEGDRLVGRILAVVVVRMVNNLELVHILLLGERRIRLPCPFVDRILVLSRLSGWILL